MPTIVVTDDGVRGITSVSHVKKVLSLSGFSDTEVGVSSKHLDAVVIILTNDERNAIDAKPEGSLAAWRITAIEYIKTSILKQYLPKLTPGYQVTVLIQGDAFSFRYEKEQANWNVLVLTDDVQKAIALSSHNFPEHDRTFIPSQYQFTSEEKAIVCIVTADDDTLRMLKGTYLDEAARQRWYKALVYADKGVIARNFSLLTAPCFHQLIVLIEGKEYTVPLP